MLFSRKEIDKSDRFFIRGNLLQKYRGIIKQKSFWLTGLLSIVVTFLHPNVLLIRLDAIEIAKNIHLLHCVIDSFFLWCCRYIYAG